MAEQNQILDYKNLNVDQLLDHLIYVRLALARLKATDEALLDRLNQLAEAGEVDQGGFTHQDHSFSWSAGRKSWSYPATIQELEALIRSAKKASEADGTAKATTGTPFWTIKPLKQP